MKRLVSLSVVLLLLLSLAAGSYADVVREADALKAMNLLKGDGGGYNLGGQLKRSEAATFIVKFLGMENEVLSNKAKYSKSSFEDVAQDAWYAPYVGYCHSEGIVSGFTDGTFKPEAFVSEKAFLTMLLQAMGYEADEDFDWNTVLSQAYTVGLSDNIEYAVRTEDNNSYIRGDVVHAMYMALDKKLKGQDKTVIERLVDRKVTNLYMAKKYDLIVVDETVTEIVSAEITDPNTVKIKLNEEVKPLDKKMIRFKIDGQESAIKSLEQDGKVITLKFEQGLFEGRTYELTLLEVTDLDGLMVEGLKSELTGVEREVIKSDDFLISYVQPLTDSMVEVYFTQPVDESAQLELMYKFGAAGHGLEEGNYRNIEVKTLPTSEYGVLIKFNELAMVENYEYEIFVRGDLTSKHGQNLNKGQGDSYVFDGVNNSLGEFIVDDVEVVDPNFIKVEFNRSVDVSSAFEEQNFKLFDKETGTSRVPTRIYFYQDEDGEHPNILMLRYSAIRESRTYRLEVKDVFDVYMETRLSNFEEEIFEKNIDFEPAVLDDIEVLDRSTIELTFSEPLDPGSDNGYVDIDQGVGIREIYWSEETPSKLRLYLKKGDYLDEDERYELVIKGGIEDYLGRDVEEDEIESFEGDDRVRENIDIVEARYVSENSIRIKLSDISRMADLEDLDNYELEYLSGTVKKKFYPTKVEVVALDEVILTMDSAYGDGTIRVYMRDIYDYSGQVKVEEMNETVERLD